MTKYKNVNAMWIIQLVQLGFANIEFYKRNSYQTKKKKTFELLITALCTLFMCGHKVQSIFLLIRFLFYFKSYKTNCSNKAEERIFNNDVFACIYFYA